MPIGAQAREAIEKFLLGEFEKLRDAWNFLLLKPDIARPLATGGAPLAGIVDIGLENDLAVAGTAVRCGGFTHA